jgi:hypothetical protein
VQKVGNSLSVEFPIGLRQRIGQILAQVIVGANEATFLAGSGVFAFRTEHDFPVVTHVDPLVMPLPVLHGSAGVCPRRAIGGFLQASDIVTGPR